MQNTSITFPGVRPGWLARLAEEEAIDPALPIVDAHHHLWHRPDDPQPCRPLGPGHGGRSTFSPGLRAFGGFLGIGTDRYPLPWNMLKYDVEKGGYVVPLDKERLEGAPRYPHDAVPPYTQEYGRSVDGYCHPYIG
jgi:hypothetical protein